MEGLLRDTIKRLEQEAERLQRALAAANRSRTICTIQRDKAEATVRNLTIELQRQRRRINELETRGRSLCS